MVKFDQQVASPTQGPEGGLTASWRAARYREPLPTTLLDRAVSFYTDGPGILLQLGLAWSGDLAGYASRGLFRAAGYRGLTTLLCARTLGDELTTAGLTARFRTVEGDCGEAYLYEFTEGLTVRAVMIGLIEVIRRRLPRAVTGIGGFLTQGAILALGGITAQTLTQGMGSKLVDERGLGIRLFDSYLLLGRARGLSRLQGNYDSERMGHHLEDSVIHLLSPRPDRFVWVRGEKVPVAVFGGISLGEGERPQGRVWVGSNATESGGRTRIVSLDLPPGARQLVNDEVQVLGDPPISDGNFDYPPGSHGFGQVQCFHSLTAAIGELKRLGYPFSEIIGARHGGRPHRLIAVTDAFDQPNAAYISGRERLLVGKGLFDGNVIHHEFAHGLLDHIQPGFLGGYGGNEADAFHEAWGDQFAAFLDRDAQIAEDLRVLLGEEADPDQGIRDLRNELRLSEVSDEPHDRGQVYAASGWSLYEQGFLRDLRLSENVATDLALRLLMDQAFSFETVRPLPWDIVIALLRGTEFLEKAGHLPVDLPEIRDLIVDEARKRELVPPWVIGELSEVQRGDLPAEVYLDSDVAIRRYESAFAIRFERMSTCHFPGGRLTIRQQLYPTRRFGDVPVLGWRLADWRNTQEEPVRVSHRDVRRISAGSIDERKNTTYEEAIELAGRRLLESLEAADRELSGVLALGRRRQMERRRLVLKLMQEAYQRGIARQTPPIVIVGRSSHLSYEIDLEFGKFYVPLYIAEKPRPNAPSTRQVVIRIPT